MDGKNQLSLKAPKLNHSSLIFQKEISSTSLVAQQEIEELLQLEQENMLLDQKDEFELPMDEPNNIPSESEYNSYIFQKESVGKCICPFCLQNFLTRESLDPVLTSFISDPIPFVPLTSYLSCNETYSLEVEHFKPMSFHNLTLFSCSFCRAQICFPRCTSRNLQQALEDSEMMHQQTHQLSMQKPCKDHLFFSLSPKSFLEPSFSYSRNVSFKELQENSCQSSLKYESSCCSSNIQNYHSLHSLSLSMSQLPENIHRVITPIIGECSTCSFNISIPFFS
ncbi:uncharacterized protein MONOS_18529 [Monocercomonoides exilis]|uniref:uncharacterized protein n=1 Tax=Monocercomonoides exilis TaxID=2049356 RepID=UPI0035599E95|nr:hypothetical protein MONOS_18529 [Monocercomonoides exilis]